MTILCALLALLVANLVIANLVITITSLYDHTIYSYSYDMDIWRAIELKR